jgi:hypothetical protein
MAWCKAGVIEGNQIHNMTYGIFQQPTAAKDIVIRNNWFKNVNKAVLLGNLGATGGPGTLTESGTLATVNISGGHNLVAGDFAQINTGGTGVFDGRIVTVLSSGLTSNQFQFNTSIAFSGSINVSGLNKVLGVNTLVVEGNVIELATATYGELIGIHLNDQWGTTNPLQDPNPAFDTFVFGTVILRDNKMRYVDGQVASNYVGYPLKITGAADLLVRNNVVDYASSITNPIRNARCGAVSYFNNQTPAGALVLGWNQDNSANYEELSTITDFALVMGLFNKKA